MKILLAAVLMLVRLFTLAQDFAEYKKAVFTTEHGQLPYRILYPINYDSSSKYPLVIFLHGAYNKGTDNEGQLAIGGRYFLNNRKNFPSIVIFPQCPADDSWAYFETELDPATGLATKWRFPFRDQPTAATALLKELLDSLISTLRVDTTKVYVGGLSQGGMGVYDLIARYPGLFAAAFSICGAGKVNTADRFAKQVSVWIFHGDADDIVPVTFSRQYFKRLKKLNADVRYSEYAGVKHNSWTIALADKDLLPWLFSKSKVR